MRRLRRKKCTLLAVALLGALVALVLLAFLAFGADPPPGTNLLLVHVVFRHGDRTPRTAYATDPHKEDAWPEGFAQLTNLGKLQTFRLGERLRERYGRLLGPLYWPPALVARSSAADRCVMSAQTLLAGLLPPAPPQRWHPDLAWQPVPVHARPRLQDDMLAAKRPCARYDAEYAAVMASPEMRAVDEQNADLYAYLTQHSGQPVNNVAAVEDLYGVLIVEKLHKLPLPDWTKEVFPEKLRPLFLLSQATYSHNDYMKRIKGGPLLREIVNHIMAKATDPLKDESKMFLYSAHDMTMTYVLRALGITEMIEHQYASAIIFELGWIEQGVNLEVKLQYLNNSETKTPTTLQIPGCGKPCDMGTFLNIVQHMLPTSWEAECQIRR